jgi:hypothetical protein
MAGRQLRYIAVLPCEVDMKKTTVSVKKIFIVFLKIGAFAFGGVCSMLAFFERALVTRDIWLTHEEFAESIVTETGVLVVKAR